MGTEKQNLWSSLFQAYNKNSMSGCSLTPDPNVKEAKLPNGLVQGHAYTITKLLVDDANNKLIRIRNPWGNEVEWNGPWSDNSIEWQSLDETSRESIGLVNDHDGEFWMDFDSFLSNWHTVQICHLSVSSFSSELESATDIDTMSWRKLASGGEGSPDPFECTVYHSEWLAGKTAGGCGAQNKAKFWTNPQFSLELSDVDLYDDESKCSLIVSLMQKDSRLKRIEVDYQESEECYIQFRLYRVTIPSDEFDPEAGKKLYANQLERIGTSGSYINSREITKRFRVEPGKYLIIPSTYDEDKHCEFLLRIFTEAEMTQASSLEVEEKDHNELTEEESFFELEDVDEIFSSWGSLMGE